MNRILGKLLLAALLLGLTVLQLAAQQDIVSKQIKTLVSVTGSLLSQMIGWANQIDVLSEQTRPSTPTYYEDQVAAGQVFWTAMFKLTARDLNILALSSR